MQRLGFAAGQCRPLRIVLGMVTSQSVVLELLTLRAFMCK